MHLIGHALTGVALLPFSPMAAVGAVLPDATWIANEYRYRTRPDQTLLWHQWIQRIPERWIVPYRIAHSLLFPLTLSLFGLHELAAGWVLHLACDWPTHGGRMQQRPLYPFPWRWPWLLRRYRPQQ
jgi:hypothetical protein